MEGKKYNKPLFIKMLVVWGFFTLVGGFFIIRSMLHTQITEGEMWREKGAKREFTERIEPARRGSILSSDDKVLASTVPVCDLCLDLGRWPKTDSKGAVVVRNGERVMESCITSDSAFMANLPKVCKILHECFPQQSIQYFYDRVLNEYRKPSPSRCFYVRRSVPYSDWDSIRHMPGWTRCVVSKTADGSVTHYVRAHIYGNLGENTIGLHYKTATSEGYTGLEGYYDSILRGRDGKYVCRRLTRGVWLPEEGTNMPLEDSTLTQRKEDGSSIVATIDTRYQDIAENALRKSMNQYGGKYGCAILMEVSTGYVLACSNLQRDDSGVVSEALWNNVAVSHKYEPGSTFKSVAMTAMLSDPKVGLDTSKRVQAGGKKSYSAKSGVINDGHGYNTDTASLSGVLARSSNVGMCELAWTYYRNRRNDLKEGMEKIFPYGRLNMDLKEQEPKTGVVRLSSDRDFLNLSYGYSCTTTPMQLITFYNALANDGKMVKPLFCRAILDGKRRSEMKPVVLNEHVCTPEVAKQMREMLVGVVEHGTGNNIKNNVYGIGGKTGTAEMLGDKAINNSSFVGFFPADNPRYTCLVLIERTSIAGRMAAAPVFKQIADCVVAFDSELGSVHMRDSGRVVNPVTTKADVRQLEHVYQLLGLPFSVIDTVQQPTGWTVYDNDQQCYRNYVLPSGVVPDCYGMTVRDAMKMLRAMGLRVKFSGQGKVVSQSPKARTSIKKGETVVLELKP